MDTTNTLISLLEWQVDLSIRWEPMPDGTLSDVIALQSGFQLHVHFASALLYQIQTNLDISNTDGSFTMANLNSFLSPYEILPIALKSKYLGKFSYFITKLYVVCTH